MFLVGISAHMIPFFLFLALPFLWGGLPEEMGANVFETEFADCNYFESVNSIEYCNNSSISYYFYESSKTQTDRWQQSARCAKLRWVDFNPPILNVYVESFALRGPPVG